MIGRAIAAITTDFVVLARIGGAIGREARAAAAELAGDPMARRAQRAAWIAELRAPVPAGLRAIDASWIEAALAGLPDAARVAIAAGGGDPTATWLARWACAALPAMLPVQPGPPHDLVHAMQLGREDLLAWLAEVGADQLAFALAGNPALAAAQRAVGQRLVAAADRITRAPRAGELGSRRAALIRCRLPLDEATLVRIGARAIAPRLDHPLAARRLVVRLPRTLGSILADDLRDASGEGPSWLALAAAW